ncbi:hypothetical protein [Luteimonas deserti]|uniref:Uncharacterized protein n=1 Tax=Luteimonas deserti TaxID=2752306 RepID=A0A7Z0TZD5_9GAMM|nr:hypothetical protein [Luteimonas deserti]NYZ62108.1 hypothetical protein [Luteimonas deserti]
MRIQLRGRPPALDERGIDQMSTHSSDEGSREQMKAEMLGRFDALLRDVASIDAGEREFMLSHLGRSLDHAISGGAGAPEPDALQGSLGDTVHMLEDSRLLDRNESGEVAAAFAPAFDLLRSEGVNRALEFARIAREQGEDAARTWLRTQGSATATGASTAAPHFIPTHVASAIGRR